MVVEVESVTLQALPEGPAPVGAAVTFRAEAQGGLDPEYAFYYR